MRVLNSVGKNVLEKALDLLNESHEDECSAIKHEIESQYYQSAKPSYRSPIWELDS